MSEGAKPERTEAAKRSALLAEIHWNYFCPNRYLLWPEECDLCKGLVVVIETGQTHGKEQP